MTCPKCGAEVPEGARFCEADGTRLALPETPASGVSHCRCGAGLEARDAEGYCGVCGHAWPEPERDRKELALSPSIAGVTDIGKRHERNEDDFTLAQANSGEEIGTLVVVCDGVSSAERADEASAAAAATACDFLQQGLRSGRTDREALMREAVTHANRSVLALPHIMSGPKDPPETTIVVVLLLAGSVTVAWVGDSRAYRIGQGGVMPLTHDHSWANEMVDMGQLTAEQARQSPQAHAITRCLGLEGEASEPSLASFPIAPDEGILVCTDGFWNYAESEQEIDRLLRALPAGTDALSACRALTGIALDRGGRDNITTVLAWPTAERKDAS